jgi:hypothetical protein
MIMRATTLLKLATLMATLLLVATAQAYVYHFDFAATDRNHNVSGTITTTNTLDAVGGFDILKISGTVAGAGGGSITALVTNPHQPFVDWNDNNLGFYYNNVLYPSSQGLDYYGVLFRVGNDVWNLYSNSKTDYELYSWTANHGVDVHGQFSMVQEPVVIVSNTDPAHVPEPSIVALMAIAGIAMRRSMNKNA